jgi:hypothetical protein
MVVIETKKIIIQPVVNPKKTIEYVNQNVKVLFSIMFGGFKF